MEATQQYRDRAIDLRERAASNSDAETRAQLQMMASDYDELAEKIEAEWYPRADS